MGEHKCQEAQLWRGATNVAGEIEKCRRGNGLNGKRRGPDVSILSNRLRENLALSWNCHSANVGP